MLRITKETDYGILVLTCFARAGSEVALTTKQLSEQTGIPYRMVCKILNLLTKKGLLQSQRGVRGGYQLVKNPQDVTLEEAICAMEGPITLTECTKDVCDCMAAKNCFVQDHWASINQAFRRALRGVTIMHMASPKKTNLFPMGVSGK